METDFTKAGLVQSAVAPHRSMALSDSKGRTLLPGQQLRHCLVFICKNTAGCAHVAGIHLCVISGKIPY